MKKRLYRSTKDKVFAGICGGIAEYFDTDPVFVRIAVVAFTLLTGIGFLLYIVCIFVIPKEPGYLPPPPPKPEPTEQEKQEYEQRQEERTMRKENRHKVFGIILIALGALFLFRNFFDFINFHEMLALIMIVIGIYLLSKNEIKGGYSREA